MAINILNDRQNYSCRKEILILASDGFKDFDFFEETIARFKRNVGDYVFLFGSGYNSLEIERRILDRLHKVLGAQVKTETFIPKHSNVEDVYDDTINGFMTMNVIKGSRPCIFIFTSDSTEKDIEDLLRNTYDTSQFPYCYVCRKQTPEEKAEDDKREKAMKRKETLSNIGYLLLFVCFIGLGVSFIYGLTQDGFAQTLICGGLVLGLLFAFYCLFEYFQRKFPNEKLVNFFRATISLIILAAILILILFVVGNIYPDSDMFINDGHRPDSY